MSIKSFVSSVLYESLSDCAGESTYVQDLPYLLLENYNNSGSYFYDRQASIDWIVDNFNELCSLYHEANGLNPGIWDANTLNPLINPESFVVGVMMFVAEQIFTDIFEDAESDDILLDEDTIEFLSHKLKSFIKE